MKRALWTLTFFFIGLLASWPTILLCYEIAHKLAWPLVRFRVGDCSDIEHCNNPLLVYTVILTTIFGPAVFWGYAGFRQARHWNMRRLAVVIPLLLALTVVFYLVVYAVL